MKIYRLVVFILVILCLALISIYQPRLAGNTSSEQYQKEKAFVAQVIDGDTIETDLGTVRLLGINTPEKNEVGYSQAKDFLMQFENQTIELLRDNEDKDRYGRMLRYVFYDNRLINLEILENGLANSYMTEGLAYEEKILRAENYSRTYGLGIWQKSSEECASCISLEELNPKEEFFIIKNNCDFDCNLTGWYVKDSGRNTFELGFVNSGEEEQFNSKSSIWNDDGDRFFMRDSSGFLVIFHSY